MGRGQQFGRVMDGEAYKLTGTEITLAVSTQYHAFPERFDWIAENGFGMAYTPDPQNLHHTPQHLAAYLKQNVPVRHHGFFPGFEIGDADKEMADLAFDLHKKAIDAMVGSGEQVMTVHMGLVPSIVLNEERLVANLGRLVQYAEKRGVRLSLENLKHGPTSNPHTVLHWAQQSGSAITLDVGHGVSCEMVQNGTITMEQVIAMFADRLLEVHFYEYETTTHHAPEDMSILAPIVDRLVETDCRWWTIELIDFADVLFTRELVTSHLASHQKVRAAV